MAIKLSAESTAQLEGYRRGLVSNADLGKWLAEIEHDESVPQPDRDALAALRTIVVEVLERSRPQDQILDKVVEILAAEGKTSITMRTSSATRWDSDRSVITAGSPVRHVGISP
jgi:hypothetical protein